MQSDEPVEQTSKELLAVADFIGAFDEYTLYELPVKRWKEYYKEPLIKAQEKFSQADSLYFLDKQLNYVSDTSLVYYYNNFNSPSSDGVQGSQFSVPQGMRKVVDELNLEGFPDSNLVAEFWIYLPTFNLATSRVAYQTFNGKKDWRAKNYMTLEISTVITESGWCMVSLPFEKTQEMSHIRIFVENRGDQDLIIDELLVRPKKLHITSQKDGVLRSDAMLWKDRGYWAPFSSTLNE